MSTSNTLKHPAPSADASSTTTPLKRAKTDSAPTDAGAATGAAESSNAPASGEVGESSPSLRGHRGRGGGRGGGGRGRGRDSRGDKVGGGKGGRGGRGQGTDSRTWGGRSDNKRGGMRQWGKKGEGEEGAAEGDEGAAAAKEGDAETDEKKERFPKRKVAVLFGYNGINYSGSQINPDVRTIEGDLFEAFVKAGCVSEDNSKSPQKVGLSRAARTDAGVHAAVNVIALKLILAPPNLPADMSLEDYVNTFLPPTIRIWSFVRVQGAFNPRALCDQRQYEYAVPTHMFLGPKPGTPMHAWITQTRKSTTSTSATARAVESGDAESVMTGPPAIVESEKFWSGQPAESSFSADLVAKKAWRMSPEILQSARDFVKAYEGSHNFYNYTVGKDFRDPTSRRIMRRLEVTDPYVVEGTEYVVVRFLGQSFMLHQIVSPTSIATEPSDSSDSPSFSPQRKMIGLAVLAIRTATPPSLVPETYGPSRIHVPKAPGLGLLLLEPQYIEYNKRIQESNKKLTDLKENNRIDNQELADQSRDPVATANCSEKVDAFKMEYIYKRMWNVEEEEAQFSKWLNFLDVYVGTDFHYLGPKGVIAEEAVFKKGENPEKNRFKEGTVPTDAPPFEDEDSVLTKGEEEG